MAVTWEVTLVHGPHDKDVETLGSLYAAMEWARLKSAEYHEHGVDCLGLMMKAFTKEDFGDGVSFQYGMNYHWVTFVKTGGFPEPAKPVPAAVTLPETTRVDLGVLCPQKPGESAVEWTNRALSHAHEHGTNRQCSIGWHGECSDSGLGEAADCNCICHGELVETYSVEGHTEDGEVTVIRAERGKHMWTEQEGEPATMWAWWVYARSEAEAAVQGATKERNRLG